MMGRPIDFKRLCLKSDQVSILNLFNSKMPRIFAAILFLLIAAAGTACSGKSENQLLPASVAENEIGESVPHVVPYLDCVPSSKDGKGSAIVNPKGPFPASSTADFEIAFTVGEDGISPGGFVMLQISPWWGWTQPQTLSSESPGFTTVRTSLSRRELTVQALPLGRIVVSSPTRGFKAGEKIIFVYQNAQVDRFAEGEELFQVFVDADADGHSACIKNPPAVRIIAREPVRLEVTAPSQVSVGTSVEIHAAPLDALGNWSEFGRDELKLSVIHDGKEIDQKIDKSTSGKKTISFSYTPRKKGIYFFNVRTSSGLKGKSNVVLCQVDTPVLQLYFGDIHGHSRMSDGTGTPEDYYEYAREVSGLNIAALTDHADYGAIPIKGAVWERIKKAANEAYEPGRFVTFLGYEWTNWKYGHRNVYYRDGDGPVFRSIDPISDTPQKLWELLKPYEAMTAAHHVGGGPVATDWSIPPGPKEFFLEISSIHGTSEFFGGDSMVYHPVLGAFVRDALSRGYKLGIVGGGDTHDGHPGQRSAGALVTGILGVYAEKLTREAVWEAFRRRQIYATSGPKIILNFRVGDSPMGSDITWEKSRGPLPLALRAVCCDQIESVEIIRNGKVVLQEKGEGITAEYILNDPNPPSGTSWYYLRVKQNDGNLAWSSPVWVTVK
jgi:hypothetical protein